MLHFSTFSCQHQTVYNQHLVKLHTFCRLHLLLVIQGVWQVAVLHQTALYHDRPRTLNEPKTTINACIRNISQANLQKVFANKIKRVQACIDARGHHFQRVQAYIDVCGHHFQRVQACIDVRGHHFQRVQACLDVRGYHFQRVQACLDVRGHHFQRVQACIDVRVHHFQRVQSCRDVDITFFNTFCKCTVTFPTTCSEE
jgi:hypothetical protein